MTKEYIEREAALKAIEKIRNKVHEHINITGRGFGRTLWAGICKGIDFVEKYCLMSSPLMLFSYAMKSGYTQK